jgi:hypothetical protein
MLPPAAVSGKLQATLDVNEHCITDGFFLNIPACDVCWHRFAVVCIV